MHPRFDFTFSYWIFGWFVLYMFGIIPYNPKLWLMIGLTANILGVLYTVMNHKIIWSHIFNYFFVNFFIKIIPIWILYKTKTTTRDFTFGIFLLVLLGLYMWIQLRSISKIVEYINYIRKGHVNDEIYTPLLYYLSKK
jgi:hypothetical protein